MASKIFARMRVRRGDLSDLPSPLLGSELGHAIDAQRLFIGNGPLSDGAPTVGNTEILTQYSPSFDILQYIYESNTLTVAQTSYSHVVGTASITSTVGVSGTLVINTISVSVSSSDTLLDVVNDIISANITDITATTNGTYLVIIGSNGQSINIGLGSSSSLLTALGLTVSITPASPVSRTLQEVLDDYVSVKAYGAKGDGSTDDSEAINRAVLDLYTVPLAIGQFAQSRRRKLFFPAGIYNIISTKVLLPPHAYLVGEGKNASQIVLDPSSTLDHIFRTADGLGQVGSAIGTSSAELPNDITVEGIGVTRTIYGAVGQLERCSSLYFRRCLFNSGWATSDTGSNIFDVSKLGGVVSMKNFMFDECEFTSYYDLFTLTGVSGLVDVELSDCNFHDAFRGTYFSNNIKNVKIIGSQFRNLENRGIYADTGATFVRSVGNSFVNVGVTNSVAPIEYTSTAVNCSSEADSFDTVGANPINMSSGIMLNSQYTGLFQNLTYSSRQGPVTLTDNTTGGSSGISFPITSVVGLFMDYVLIRNGDYRIGTIRISSDSSANAYLFDNYDENLTSGTTFDVTVFGGNINVVYTTTSTGHAASLYYSYRYF